METKIKVLNIFASLDFGGVESHALMLDKGSKYSEYNHAYIAISNGGDIENKLKKRNCDVYTLNCDPKIPSISTIWSLYKVIKELDPDVVHTRGAEATFHGIIAAKLAGTKVKIAEEIGIPTHSLFAKVIFRLTYSFTDKLVAISQAVKQWIVDNGEASSSKVQVIYNPTDFFSENSKRDTSSKYFSIGFIGRLENVKNPLSLVKAIKILRDRGELVKLELVGDGRQKESILNFIKNNSLQDLITVHGFQSEPHISIENCDLYVQPSITEGFGIAVVEVMGAGIPVLASAVGGIPEFIDDKDNGWLLKSVDSQSIADSIQSILEITTEERLIIAKRGRDSVVSRFTIEKYITNLHDMYSSLLNEK
ncbi:glycosyltransferase [uncultured Vibrio sp.]|uniref:glycosyltransferase n=1 Tax=uncultured Vibrio sp. TaxID=114054 RepID=UPI002AAB6E13|nr:glycosyltransferase [uncultured Vibrio sp.]